MPNILTSSPSARFAGATRRFALLAALALAFCGVAVVWKLDQDFTASRLRAAEVHNVALARALGRGLRAHFDPLMHGREIDAAAITLLYREVRGILGDLDVVKVKVYTPAGRTVFSTEAAQIGEDKSDNAGFQRAARGEVASEYTFRGSFSAFESVIENRDVLSTYVPIRVASLPPDQRAVFEIYLDVTTLMEDLRGGRVALMLAVGIPLVLVFALLWWVADRYRLALAREHQGMLRLTAQVAEAETSNRMKSSFLANVSHEIRTPLNAILGFAEMLSLGHAGPLTDKQVDYVRDIRNSSAHLRGLLEDMLDMARIEAGRLDLEFEVVRPRDLVEEAVGMIVELATSRRIAIDLDLGDPPALRVDRRRARQVLLNLLSNAVKFTAPGGTVTVRAGLPTSSLLRLSVTDNGPGIPPADLPNVLEPFGQSASARLRDGRGAGLGLPIAMKLAELHGGSLSIVSEVGRGTTVTLALPLAQGLPL